MTGISGYFITPTPEETQLINETLKDEGYEVSPSGLKEWILDIITAEEEPQEERDKKLGEQISAFLRENPETVTMYAGLGAGVVKGLVDRMVAGIVKKARG